jgi:FMN-dependent NADH-azoreductase
MSVLHISSSARTAESNSRAIGRYLVERLQQPVVRRDLGAQPLPAVSSEQLLAVQSSDVAEAPEHVALSDALIEELNAAEALVVEAPMYNFSVPVVLKQWIDNLYRAGVTFRYGANGPEGLVKTRRAFVIVSSGGTPVGSDMDFVSPYMKQVLQVLGIDEVHIVAASGSKGDPEAIIADGKQQIDALLQ